MDGCVSLQAAWVTAENPSRSICLIFLTDVPSGGAKYGVQDDDNNVITEFNGESLHIDNKFSVWTERSAGEEGMTADGALPGNHFGRFAVRMTDKLGGVNKHNQFLKKSKLCTRHRPNEVVVLPPYRDILHCESLNPDTDLMTRDRLTSSLEQLAAQKGPVFMAKVLDCMLDGLGLTQNDAVLVVDYSPHLGCNAIAAKTMQNATSNTNLYYVSFHTDPKEHAYATARVDGALAKDWFNGVLQHPEIKPEREVPPLPPSKVEKIPGASAAMGNMASVTWNVCAVIDGELNILDQHLSGLETAAPRYYQAIEKMKSTRQLTRRF